MIVGCEKPSGTIVSREAKSLYFQHDYYPDSIFLTRSITWDIVHESAYSYCLEFAGDSCQFIGYHESWWKKIKKIKENTFVTAGLSTDDYFEFEFLSRERIRMRNIRVKGIDSVKYAFKYYHIVPGVLTQLDLQKRMAKELFAGTYQVIYKDSLQCDSVIIIDENFKITGIKHFSTYGIETEIDWDFGLENACWLAARTGGDRKYFSFKFSGDSLTFFNYEMRETEDGMIPKISQPLFVGIRRN